MTLAKDSADDGGEMSSGGATVDKPVPGRPVCGQVGSAGRGGGPFQVSKMTFERAGSRLRVGVGGSRRHPPDPEAGPPRIVIEP